MRGLSREEVEQKVLEKYPGFADDKERLSDFVDSLLEFAPKERVPQEVTVDLYADLPEDKAEQALDLALTVEDVEQISQFIDQISPGIPEDEKSQQIDSFSAWATNLRNKLIGKSELSMWNTLRTAFPALKFNEVLLKYYADKFYKSPGELKLDEILSRYPDIAEEAPDKEVIISQDYDNTTIRKWVEKYFSGIPSNDREILTQTLIDWRDSEKERRSPEKTKVDIEEREPELEETAEVGEIIEAPHATYNAMLDVLEAHFKKPYSSITDEELSYTLQQPELVEQLYNKIEQRLLEYHEQYSRQAEKIRKETGRAKPVPMVSIPSEIELRTQLQEALKTGRDLETKRQEATMAREKVLQDFDIKPEYRPAILEGLTHAPTDILRHFLPGPVEESKFIQYPFLSVTGKDTYKFDLDAFTKMYWNDEQHRKYLQSRYKNSIRKLQKEIIDSLKSAGYFPEVGMVYRMVGKNKVNAFTDALNKYFPYEFARVAAYFALFKDFDLAGSSWTLDEGVKQIMRKPIDTEKIVKEGGYWEHNVGDQVMLDTDIGPVQVTITAKMPSRKYMIKNNSGIEQEVNEDQLFTSENLI